MFEIFLPYLIGTALGISPQSAPENNEMASVGDGSGDVAMERTPEDQTPTGQFTTATEIKPILNATMGSWVAVRNWEGQDLVYFTQLLAWRCGIWDISYGINGADPDQVLPMEPCHEGTNSPNALTDIENFLPYVVLPENTVENLTVQLTLDDGSVLINSYDRPAIQMP